jgi:8-oxo-dGTP diphosphatase
MIVVTCAIIENGGRILVTQRSEKMDLPLKWEFPGGKIEEGETIEECLVREIFEELNIQIKILLPLQPNVHLYPNGKEIYLLPFACEYISGSILLTEHADFKWLKKEELSSLDWAEADIPIVQAYINQ